MAKRISLQNQELFLTEEFSGNFAAQIEKCAGSEASSMCTTL